MEREANSLWKRATRAQREDFKHIFQNASQSLETEASQAKKAKEKKEESDVAVVKEALQPDALRQICKAVNGESEAIKPVATLRDSVVAQYERKKVISASQTTRKDD